MTTYLVEGRTDIDRIDAIDWQAAEAGLGGNGKIIGELVLQSKNKTFAFGMEELKFNTDDKESMTFTGYGAVFGNIDNSGDLISQGAFSKTLQQFKTKSQMPPMLYEHGSKGGGPAMPVGVWTGLAEDSHGLKVEGRLAETSMGRDLYVLLKAGAIAGLSIGYRVREIGRPEPGSDVRRNIKSADLVEISLVNDPMNEMARLLSVKSADDIITIRDLEKTLRDVGHSRADAVRICARFEAKADQRDAGEEEAIRRALRRNLSLINQK